jgi:hypothetical protein
MYTLMEETVRIDGQEARVLKFVIGLIGDVATYFPYDQGVRVKSTQSYVEQSILKL